MSLRKWPEKKLMAPAARTRVKKYLLQSPPGTWDKKAFLSSTLSLRMYTNAIRNSPITVSPSFCNCFEGKFSKMDEKRRKIPTQPM